MKGFQSKGRRGLHQWLRGRDLLRVSIVAARE